MRKRVTLPRDDGTCEARQTGHESGAASRALQILIPLVVRCAGEPLDIALVTNGYSACAISHDRVRRNAQQLLDQVDVREDHATAAIALEAQAVERFSAASQCRRKSDESAPLGQASLEHREVLVPLRSGQTSLRIPCELALSPTTFPQL